jgi:hypothetical protein
MNPSAEDSKMKKTRHCLALTALILSSIAHAEGVDFIQPKDGDTVTSTFTVKFSVDGKKLAKSGDETPGTGHHHLLVNAADVPERYTIPRNDQYKHFDRGQSESLVFLPPGKYTLTLQFGDGAHRSYGEAYRKKIDITVVPDKD